MDVLDGRQMMEFLRNDEDHKCAADDLLTGWSC